MLGVVGLMKFLRCSNFIGIEDLDLLLNKDGYCGGSRVIVPRKHHQEVLQMLHKNHVGIIRMKSIARTYVWWPGLWDWTETWKF